MNSDLKNEIKTLSRENNYCEYYICSGVKTDYNRLREYFKIKSNEKNTYDFKIFSDSWKYFHFDTIHFGHGDQEATLNFIHEIYDLFIQELRNELKSLQSQNQNVNFQFNFNTR